ncbi:uncharacterized protein LOC109800385 [Cajanus cajan]|uniref:uncharacterized protein LOC109800385 n=1 Tax=Cajanus cajan TaxID=3821 RepID=UPI0010FB9872|nr:uncharacterized protein LOC109800385 [Cajanus cajan]
MLGLQKIMRLWSACYEQLVEVLVSCLVLVLYGFDILSSDVGEDLSGAIAENVKVKEEMPKGERETQSHHELSPPIVLVHGYFGFGSFAKGRLGALCDIAEAVNKGKRVLAPDLGSLTSIYDRARELFYYLKGGQVDYGEEHSKACGHIQFGRIYERGYYPEWDEDHPVHFVGHLVGAQVVRVLQQMLADKAFKGYENTSENWVLCLTSVSGALNGTTRAYIDGMRPEDGGRMKPFCLLQLCRIGVIIYYWFDISRLKKYYNFGLDHFNMSWKKMGLWGIVQCLLGNSGPFASGDWILPDLTIQGSIRLNNHLHTFPNTYYFSYATKRSWKFMGVTVHSWILGIPPLLFFRVWQMGRWLHPPHVSPPYKAYRNEDWQENDGTLNTISMTHPRFPIEHPSCLVEKDSECQPLQPGIWYYKFIEGDHIALTRAGVAFDLIYERH